MIGGNPHQGRGRMTLREYHLVHGTPYSFIARKCGVTSQAISQIASGVRRPTWELAGRIEKATFGRISRANWFSRRPIDGRNTRPKH
jgi:DNA-binding transcriptional regulator YdaS (Cro superfamily)